MPITLNLTSHDKINERLQTEKIFINDIDIFNTENKEKLDNLILKNYSADNLSIIPSCSCPGDGGLKGAYYIGDKCYKCGSIVTSSTDDNISFLLWVKQPQTVAPFITPIVLALLLHRYKITKPNMSLITYIMLPNYKIDKKQQRKNIGQLEKLDFLLARHNIKRGYNSFVENFFTIIEILENEFVKGKRPEDPDLDFVKFLEKNKDNIFSTVLPFPNKVIFTMESNELGKFIDKSLLNPINVIRRLTGIDLRTLTSGNKQDKVANSLIDLSEFYMAYFKSVIFSKPGLIRQHTGSTRSHFTCRAVITSITDPHNYDDVYLPWSIGVTLLREHILNRLYKRGYSYKQAANFILYHTKIYHPVLDEIFKEIIAATPRGLSGLLNRNPSLHRGSIQHIHIPRIKTDVTDTTFSMSYLIAPAFNADFDGDELNMTLALTEKTHRHLHNFDPHHNILSLSGPNDFTTAIKFPKTIVSTLSNWIDSDD